MLAAGYLHVRTGEKARQGKEVMIRLKERREGKRARRAKNERQKKRETWRTSILNQRDGQGENNTRRRVARTEAKGKERWCVERSSWLFAGRTVRWFVVGGWPGCSANWQAVVVPQWWCFSGQWPVNRGRVAVDSGWMADRRSSGRGPRVWILFFLLWWSS